MSLVVQFPENQVNRQKDPTQETFGMVRTISEKAAEIFYNKLCRLFELSLKLLFKGEMKEQGQNLIV